MKNKNPINILKDEIDLIEILKIIWDGKIKILLITIISIIVGLGYNSQIPTNYSNSLTINSHKTHELMRLDNLHKLIKSNQSNQPNQSNPTPINQLLLDRFIYELADYEEFLLSIKNTKKIQDHFSKLNIEDKKKELFKYAQLLEIVKPNDHEEKYILNFKWNDPDEVKKILQDTLDLTSKNLKRSIDLELSQTLEFEKKLLINQDSIRLDYLKEQSDLAKELNIIDNQIIDNQIDNVNLTPSSVSLSINTASIAYYLRGYKAIDKEIQLIENREYQNLKFIQQELNSFKTENIKFADFNVNLISTQTLQDTKLNLKILILLGLIVGIFFVLISNAFQLKKELKETN